MSAHDEYEIHKGSHMNNALQKAAEQLKDVGATFEYPGFISVSRGGKTYNIGDANGEFGYDVQDNESGDFLEGGEVPYSDISPLSSSAEELASWVRQLIESGGVE